ncbi:MAG: AMP-binding protein, partial [Thermoanaerobaculia bacterium]
GPADVWCCPLPSFHVGGLGIVARAWLNGARVVDLVPWSAAAFERLCEQERVTLTSLVPAQLSDLVRAGLRSPQSLRAAVIGGGALAAPLYEAARELGWPILPSYGMTECSSQVATARAGAQDLVLLDHVEVRTEDDGAIAIRSPALLTAYLIEEGGLVDPKLDGWFVTADVGEIEGKVLRVVGRRGDFVKIGGESVDLGRLDRLLAELVDPSRAALAALPDERLGHVIVMAYCDDGALLAVEPFNRRVMPFERIRRTVRVETIPRTELGKLARKRLQDLVE